MKTQLFNIPGQVMYLKWLGSQLDEIAVLINKSSGGLSHIHLVEKGMFISDIANEIADILQDKLLESKAVQQRHIVMGTLGDYKFHKMMFRIQYNTFAEDKFKI